MPRTQTLDEYAKVDERKSCPVCQLPVKLREQIRTRRRGVRLDLVASWLRGQGYSITDRQLTSHMRGSHEPPVGRTRER